MYEVTIRRLKLNPEYPGVKWNIIRGWWNIEKFLMPTIHDVMEVRRICEAREGLMFIDSENPMIGKYERGEHR
jgi:hypothetical protein